MILPDLTLSFPVFSLLSYSSWCLCVMQFFWSQWESRCLCHHLPGFLLDSSIWVSINDHQKMVSMKAGEMYWDDKERFTGLWLQMAHVFTTCLKSCVIVVKCRLWEFVAGRKCKRQEKTVKVFLNAPSGVSSSQDMERFITKESSIYNNIRYIRYIRGRVKSTACCLFLSPKRTKMAISPRHHHHYLLHPLRKEKQQ